MLPSITEKSKINATVEVKSVKNNVKDFWDDHYSSDFDASIEVDGKLFTAEKTTELKNKFLLII